LLLSPAGDGRAIEVEEFVKVSVGGLGPQELILEMGIAPLPVDAIIGWSDIRNQGLVSLLFDAAAIQIPSLREFAPEEYEEEDEEEVVADKLTNEILSKWKIEFPEVFSGKLSSVPAELEGMEIILKEGASLPMSKPPRHHSGAVRKFISDEVSKWLEDGIIAPSNASYASQVVVVKAPGKDYRLCVDYQELNSVTKPDLFPLPSVKPLLRRVAGKGYYA
jgi:hypothetical protein